MLSSRSLRIDIAGAIDQFTSPWRKKRASKPTCSRNPRQGAHETASARRPVFGARFRRCFHVQEPKGSGWRYLREAARTLARRSNCLIAVHWHGWRYPLCQMSSGHLSVARRQRTTGPAFAGWENPRRKIGSIQGAMARKARSTNRAGDRLAAGLQPGQPSRCLKATILGGRKQSPLARRALIVAEDQEGPEYGIMYTVPVSRRHSPPGEGQPPAYCPV